MAYGKSRNAKKLVLDLSFLSYSQKNEKIREKLPFFTDFWSTKIVDILGLVINRRYPRAPLEKFIQAVDLNPNLVL